MSLVKFIDVEELEVRNPLILLHGESATSGGADDTHDIGFFGQYWDGVSLKYTGFFRDASDSGTYKLFSGLSTLPTVDTGSVADVSSNLASLSVNNMTVGGDLVVSGTTTTVNVATLTVEDNIIISNSGPANQKEDGGFVVRRTVAGVIADTPKESGTLDAAGTTTTVTLPANHNTTADNNVNYYKGWVIDINGTDSAVIASSTAPGDGNPVVLTLATAISAPAGTEPFELFNKQYVGMIYDESTDKVTMYGFPREDTEAVINTSGGTSGNLADYVDLYAASLGTSGGITSGTGITATTGNIVASSGNVTASGTVSGNVVTSTTTVTAGTGITSTTGNIVASSGNITASSGTVSGNAVTSTTTVTAGTGVTITTGNLTVSSGNANITGNLSVSGAIQGPVRIDDNILAINTGPLNNLTDGGFVVQRSAANVVAADTPKETGTASASGTTTTITLQASNGHGTTLDYYKGWIIKFGGDVTGTATVTSNTAANPPVLTFDTAASGSTTTSTTYQLFNKRFVGAIYDESLDQYSFLGFPREDAEGVIDPTAPVNGNVPDYLNLAIQNLTVNGTSVLGASVLATITQVAATTFTTSQIKNNDIIYLNPTGGNTTYTLPALSAIAMALNTADTTTFVNIHATNIATIVPNGADTIEGGTIFLLKRQWQKFTLIASNTTTISNTWLIE